MHADYLQGGGSLEEGPEGDALEEGLEGGAKARSPLSKNSMRDPP